MKNQIERLQELYDLAVLKELVKSKGDFAVLIGINSSNLSHAMKGDGKVSLENTIKKAEHALMRAGVDVFASGDGSMQNVTGSHNSVGVPAKNFTHEGEWFALVAEKDKQIDRLLGIIEKMQNV